MKHSIIKRSLALALAGGLALSTLPAQTADSAAEPPAAQRTMADNQPQIAYRIFRDYVDNKSEDEAKSKLGWGIGMTIAGGLCLAATAVNLALPASTFGPDPDLQMRLAIGGGISGAVLTGVGVAMLASPIPDYREKYRLVFQESDPIVQEALAASSLKEIADKARDGRVFGALSQILTPLVYIGANMIINTANNRPTFQGTESGLYWLAGSTVSGGISLFTQTSEERLWEKYVSARDAMYAIPGGHK